MYDRAIPDCKIYKSKSLVVTIIINNTTIENTLIDLGSTINMMTTVVLEFLQLGKFLRPTSSILELADRTMVKPVGVLDEIVISVAIEGESRHKST